MSTPWVEQLLFDDENEEKLWRHGLIPDDPLAVLEGRYRIARNKRGHRASFLIAGWDGQGRCVPIPIKPTHDPVIWRPVTAWVATSPHQRSWFRD